MSDDFNITQVLLQYLCLLFSLCVHEASHAFVADRCGDPSARLMGRVTLNPLAHIDPIGTVVMPLLMLATHVPLIGWAKPVPVNPLNLRNMRRDNVLISIAGPASNLVLALISVVVLKVLIIAFQGSESPIAENIILVAFQMSLINVLLMLFNLIPVPPLDGSHVLHFFLPPGGQRVLQSIGPFGIIIALLAARYLLPGPMMFIIKSIIAFAYWGVPAA